MVSGEYFSFKIETDGLVNKYFESFLPLKWIKIEWIFLSSKNGPVTPSFIFYSPPEVPVGSRILLVYHSYGFIEKCVPAN